MHYTLSRTVNEGARNGNLPINKLMKLIYFLLEMSSNVKFDIVNVGISKCREIYRIYFIRHSNPCQTLDRIYLGVQRHNKQYYLASWCYITIKSGSYNMRISIFDCECIFVSKTFVFKVGVRYYMLNVHHPYYQTRLLSIADHNEYNFHPCWHLILVIALNILLYLQ